MTRTFTDKEIEKVLKDMWYQMQEEHDINPHAYHEDYLEAIDEAISHIQSRLKIGDFKIKVKKKSKEALV